MLNVLFWLVKLTHEEFEGRDFTSVYRGVPRLESLENAKVFDEDGDIVLA